MGKKGLVIGIIIVVILIIFGFYFLYNPSATLGGEYDGIINDAKFSGDASLCDQIDDLDYKNYCLAGAKKDKTFCEQVQDQTVKDRCYFTVPYSIETCNAIQSNDLKGECLLNLGITTLDSSICEIIPDLQGDIRTRDNPDVFEKRPSHFRDNCFLGIRLETDNISLCENIIEEYNYNYCISPPKL